MFPKEQQQDSLDSYVVYSYLYTCCVASVAADLHSALNSSSPWEETHKGRERERESERDTKKMACFLRTCLLALKITSKPVLRSGVSSREKFFGNEMNRQKNLSSSYFSNQSIKLPSISRCFLLFYFRLPFFFFNFILPF